MDTDYGIVHIRNILHDVTDECAELVRYGITDCIGNVYCSGSGFYSRRHNLFQKSRVAPERIFSAELHIVDIAFCQPDRFDGQFEHFFRLFVKLVLHMDARCGDKRMDSRMCSAF